MEKAKENEIKDSIDYKKLEWEIKQFKWIASALVIVGLFAFAIGAGSVLMTGESKWAQSLGDFSGGVVASFWSLAGIMLVYIAFIGQKQQLMLQEEELRLTRDEMISTRMEIEGQKREMEEQNKTAALQRFENTFFNLIRAMGDSITYIQIRTNTPPLVSSYGAISYLSDRLYNRLSGFFENIDKKSVQKELIERSNSFINEVHRISTGENPFIVINQLYIVINFVNASELSEDEKYIYYSILFSRLNGNLISLALYIGLVQNQPLIDHMVNLVTKHSKENLSIFLCDESHLVAFSVS
jgi:hypothetical protein